MKPSTRLYESELDKIKKWEEDGVITLEVSFSVIDESGRGSHGEPRLSEVDNYVHLEGNNFLGKENEEKKKIEDIVFPNGAKKKNEKMDIQILYDVRCSGATLITLDGNSNSQPRGILGSKNELENLCIRVLSPLDAVSEIENLIKERDNNAKLDYAFCDD
jgi:hypothetical protein